MSEVIVTHVQPGETLSEIAARYGVSVEALQRWNRIEDPDLVVVDQRIVVYNAVDAAGSVVATSTEWLSAFKSLIVNGPHEVAIGGAIALGLLLMFLLLHRTRRDPISILDIPSRLKTQWKAQVNDGERTVSASLRRRYRDWILIDNVMLPSGHGTTQIDHILVSPSLVFLIETKDMSGWVFGSPGNRQWTQSYVADRWSRMAGIKSKRFRLYNPLWQNEGHARALVRLGIVDLQRLRPIVVFVGDAEVKTADEFLPFDEHEEIASQNRKYRMRGVVCMSLKELHRYIGFTISASANSDLAREEMEAVGERIRKKEIRMTAESHAKHVDFVRSVKELSAR